jgi:hypothetical protein
MKTFPCLCNNTLYFENSRCLTCTREVGWCPVCKGIHALLPDDSGGYTCANPECNARLIKCHNYAVHDVCNRMVAAPAAESSATGQQTLCDYCRFNETIPDLSVPGNAEKWYRLEVAKRRLLYALDELQLPYGTRAEGFPVPLSFDFKADQEVSTSWWRNSDGGEKVYTGHANGKITINIREADPVERERMRIELGEPQRTLIGHFRHEIGHYYWQLLVQGKDEAAFKALFGDHENPSYSEALQQYYAYGPAPDWRNRYISAYASMHPWEDFAETWGTYMDMISVLDTSENVGLLRGEGLDPEGTQLGAMVLKYLEIGMKVNEVNRAMGLMDILPEFFSEPVMQKMRYIHRLIRKARRSRYIQQPVGNGHAA